MMSIIKKREHSIQFFNSTNAKNEYKERIFTTNIDQRSSLCYVS